MTVAFPRRRRNALVHRGAHDGTLVASSVGVGKLPPAGSHLHRERINLSVNFLGSSGSSSSSTPRLYIVRAEQSKKPFEQRIYLDGPGC